MRIQKEIENVERVKDKIATMPLTMEDAIEFHKQVVDRVEKERKEINKELDLDDDIEEKGFTGASKEPKKVSTPELKKMKLSESLFESVLNESFIKNEKQLAKYIANNFEEITGLNVKDIYNKESDEEIFNQEYVDITYPIIKQFIYDFNEDNDTNFDEEDILYLLDDELSSYKYFNESLNEGYSITDFNKLKRILKKVADDPNSIVIDPDYTTIDVINGKNCYCIYANGIEDHIIDHITQKLEDDFYTDVEVFDVKTNSNNIDFNKLPKAAKEDLEKYGEEELNNSYYICIALKNSVDESLNECNKFKKGDCKNYALDEDWDDLINDIDREDREREQAEATQHMIDQQEKEAEKEERKAKEEAKRKERIGDDAWGEKDWIAEREKGDLDLSKYSDEEKAEIEKRLRNFDNDPTAQAKYKRKKEEEARKKEEEERKRAQQKKEEKIKQGIDTFGKAAKAPGELLNAVKKGLNIK